MHPGRFGQQQQQQPTFLQLLQLLLLLQQLRRLLHGRRLSTAFTVCALYMHMRLDAEWFEIEIICICIRCGGRSVDSAECR